MGRWLVLFVLLCSASVVFADNLECKYTTNETYEVFEDALVLENTLIKKADLLTRSDFTSGEQSTFTVYNPNNFEVFAKYVYTVSGHGAGEAEKGLRILPKSYAVLKHYCFYDNTMGNCSIIPESVMYYVVRPEVLFPRKITVLKTREVCQICCGGIVCLNNGTNCSKDCECGANVCNIAKTCGGFIECPNGLLNCKNQSCLQPSTKGGGEAYTCEGECKYGARDNNVCAPNPWGIWIVFGLIILGFVVIIGFVKRRQVDDSTKQLEKLQTQIDESTKQICELKSNMTKGEKEKARLEKEKADLVRRKNAMKKDIEKIDKKIKNAARIADEKIESELERIKLLKNAEFKRIEQDFYEKNKELAEQRREIKKIEQDIAENKGILHDKIKQKDEQYHELFEKDFKKLQAEYPLLEVKKVDGYPAFIHPDGTYEWIHKYRYEQAFGEVPPSSVIHHIDKNPNNAELWNLIAIPKEKHKYEIKHGRIPFGDWEMGLDVLMDTLGWTKKNLHKYIIKHMEELEANSKNPK